MKNTAKLLTAALISLTTLSALVSCGGGSTSDNGHTHIYENKRPDIDTTVITDATCIQKGEYYYICSCGALGEETYELDYQPHDYSLRIEDEAHLASEADCTNSRKYYYTCSVCSDVSDTETFSSGYPTGHVYENNVCIYGCGTSQNKYTLSADAKYYTLTSFTEDVEIAVIPANYNGLPVKSIGSHAFAGVKVREVVLPASVDTIEKSAFYDDKSLEKINLGAVKTIGESAFAFCSSLAEADISSVVSLGAYSLSRTAITEITLPEGIVDIGEGALYDCPSLTRINYLAINAADLQYPSSILGKNDSEAAEISLYVGKKVARIPNSAFSYSRITKIEFAEDSSCRVIGAFAFNNSLGEKALTLTSVETVGERAFEHSGITELTLGGRINAVGNLAFSHCEGLTRVVIAANRGGFGDSLFASGADSLDIYYLHNGDEPIRRALWNSNANLIIGKNVKKIPANFEEGGVLTLRFEEGASDVSIGNKAFISSISGVLDLSPVTSIGSQAFYRTGIDAPLTRVIIGKGLGSIGAYAFGEVQEILFLAEYCGDVTSSDAAISSAERIVIGKGVRRIPGYLLYGANVNSISFESGSLCEEIGERAFYHAKISGFSLPSTVKTIGAHAFENASGVTEKLDLNGVTTFGAYAFRDYAGEIDISNSSATSIASYAFNGANVTGTLTLDRVTEVGEGAFRGCTGITKLVFGKNFKTANSNAFRECTGISEVEFNAISANDLESPIFSNSGKEGNFRLTIAADVTRIPDYMFGSSAVSSISFAGNSRCSSIGRYAFSHTYRLESAEIAIPDSVENIEEAAFALTKAKTIILGKGIKTIGDGAFRAMGIIGEEQHGFIEEIYFAADTTLVATKIGDGSKETLVFAKDSSANALNYAKIFFRPGYTYSLQK